MIKYIRYIFLLLGIAAGSASAEQYDTPVSICLNDHTIPLINTDKSAIEIVDAAYEQCREVVLQWKEERKTLPPEMVAKQDNEFRAFYVHMIEVRRKSMEKSR